VITEAHRACMPGTSNVPSAHPRHPNGTFKSHWPRQRGPGSSYTTPPRGPCWPRAPHLQHPLGRSRCPPPAWGTAGAVPACSGHHCPTSPTTPHPPGAPLHPRTGGRAGRVHHLAKSQQKHARGDCQGEKITTGVLAGRLLLRFRLSPHLGQQVLQYTRCRARTRSSYASALCRTVIGYMDRSP
jgi:hypothetical protein